MRICLTRPSMAAWVPSPSMMVVLSLSMVTFFDADVLELQPEVLGDRLAAGERRDVLEHRLPPVTEARRLDRGALQRAAQLVHHQGGERLALDVLRHDEQRPIQAGHLLEQRQQVLHRADLLLVDQDDRILELSKPPGPRYVAP